MTDVEVEARGTERRAARVAGDFERADRLRDELAANGVFVLDIITGRGAPYSPDWQLTIATSCDISGRWAATFH